MSQLTYSGVTLPYPLTVAFEQSAQYDEMGGEDTDWYCTRVDITVQSIIHADYIGDIAPDLANINDLTPVQIMQVIRSRLLKPRQRLSFTFNGNELIPQLQDGNQGTVDAKNGPLPQSCNLQQLTNTSFLLSYHIIGHYWENIRISPGQDDGIVINQKAYPALYNRWTETVEIDNRNYSKRTREGKYVIRSDNQDGKVADMYRNNLAVLGVPDGFLRTSSAYTISSDGLSLSYRIVDDEVYRKPPSPAFTATGTYRENSVNNGAVRYAEASYTLTGDKGTNQDRLLQVALGMCTAKVGKAAGGISKIIVLESVDIAAEMYENSVSASIRAMIPAGNRVALVGEGRKVPIAYDGFSAPAEGGFDNPNYFPGYLDRGSAGLLVQAAAYWDANVGAVLVHKNDTFTSLGVTTGKDAKNQANRGKDIGAAGINAEN